MLAHLKQRIRIESERRATRLWKECNEIDHISGTLRLPYATHQLVVKIYNRASDIPELQPDVMRPVLIATSIYSGCKLSRYPVNVSDICLSSKISFAQLRSGYNLFMSHWTTISGMPRGPCIRHPNGHLCIRLTSNGIAVPAAPTGGQVTSAAQNHSSNVIVID